MRHRVTTGRAPSSDNPDKTSCNGMNPVARSNRGVHFASFCRVDDGAFRPDGAFCVVRRPKILHWTRILHDGWLRPTTGVPWVTNQAPSFTRRSGHCGIKHSEDADTVHQSLLNLFWL